MSRVPVFPKVIRLDLSVARDRELFSIEGDTLIGFRASNNSVSVGIRLETSSGDSLEFMRGTRLRLQEELHPDGKVRRARFNRFYVSNTAQGATFLTLVVGGPESAELDSFSDLSISSIAVGTVVNATKPASPNTNLEVAVGVVSTVLGTYGLAAGNVLLRLSNVGAFPVRLSFGTGFGGAPPALVSHTPLDPGEKWEFVAFGAFEIRGIAVGGASTVQIFTMEM